MLLLQLSLPQVFPSTSPLNLPLYNSSINIIYICTPYNLDKHNIHASLGCSLSLEFFQGDECKHYACIVDFVIGVKPVYSYFFSRTCIYSQFHHPINFAFPILYSTLIMTSTASTPLIYHYAWVHHWLRSLHLFISKYGLYSCHYTLLDTCSARALYGAWLFLFQWWPFMQTHAHLAMLLFPFTPRPMPIYTGLLMSLILISVTTFSA